MYDMDKYDSCIEHFDKDYNFYLLTDPEKTYELYDGSYPFIETKHKYLKSLQRSQWRTANSKSMLELTRSGWYNGLWIQRWHLMKELGKIPYMKVFRAQRIKQLKHSLLVQI
jgi:hypothetical protein